MLVWHQTGTPKTEPRWSSVHIDVAGSTSNQLRLKWRVRTRPLIYLNGVYCLPATREEREESGDELDFGDVAGRAWNVVEGEWKKHQWDTIHGNSEPKPSPVQSSSLNIQYAMVPTDILVYCDVTGVLNKVSEYFTRRYTGGTMTVLFQHHSVISLDVNRPTGRWCHLGQKLHCPD